MIMPTFTAIDFETAHPKRWSICQVGLVRVEAGVVTKRLSLLVQPPENEYWSRFTEIHGLSWEDTAYEPSFVEVWPQIREFIEGQTLVAHNMGFDGSCLNQVLDYYGMDPVAYKRQCTLKLYGKALNILCEECGIELNHHDALSDANACAELYLRHLTA